MLATRGISVTHKAIRQWGLKFGGIRQPHPPASTSPWRQMAPGSRTQTTEASFGGGAVQSLREAQPPGSPGTLLHGSIAVAGAPVSRSQPETPRCRPCDPISRPPNRTALRHFISLQEPPKCAARRCHQQRPRRRPASPGRPFRWPVRNCRRPSRRVTSAIP